MLLIGQAKTSPIPNSNITILGFVSFEVLRFHVPKEIPVYSNRAQKPQRLLAYNMWCRFQEGLIVVCSACSTYSTECLPHRYLLVCIFLSLFCIFNFTVSNFFLLANHPLKITDKNAHCDFYSNRTYHCVACVNSFSSHWLLLFACILYFFYL